MILQVRVDFNNTRRNCCIMNIINIINLDINFEEKILLVVTIIGSIDWFIDNMV